MAELDLKLAKEFRSCGYGSDVLRTLARWLFTQGFQSVDRLTELAEQSSAQVI